MSTSLRASALSFARRAHLAGILTASSLSLAALFASAPASHAHEYKAGDIAIGHPWSRQTPEGAKVAGGFLVLTNTGATADRLVGVSSPISMKGEIHQMAVDDKGVMTMRPVEGGLEVPAGGSVELKPGSYHLMFMGLTARPVEGDNFEATLEFEKAGKVTVEFAVEGMGGAPKHEGHSGHGG
ncbi:copper chaperone PCu(A)C [Aquibium sp. ELW1220]|uniref:copper chaperone PCu(A)C n=1 Tax=Aquibium sp. ELW1220 TaxID=2976766 RepID=UPI0025B1FA94|nr:copper chaperone PCu(A)C [Aquibium sp. ELW1220]MDN2580794.1 copper chaperone PCu(A)C [Aquibium sp. ELW1220]